MLISDCGSCLKVGSQEHFIPKKKKNFAELYIKLLLKVKLHENKFAVRQQGESVLTKHSAATQYAKSLVFVRTCGAHSYH